MVLAHGCCGGRMRSAELAIWFQEATRLFTRLLPPIRDLWGSFKDLYGFL